MGDNPLIYDVLCSNVDNVEMKRIKMIITTTITIMITIIGDRVSE